MSKQNKQTRARNYADGVADHIRRTKAQQLRCAAENEKLDKSLEDLSETIVKAQGYLDDIDKALLELQETAVTRRKSFEALKESVGLRQQVTRTLVSDTAMMATVIQTTAAVLGIDLSNVEAAEADEPVSDSVEAVEKASDEVVAAEVPA